MMNFVLSALYFDFSMQSTKFKVQRSKANNHGIKSQQPKTREGFRT
jgi:hypothetical protein